MLSEEEIQEKLQNADKFTQSEKIAFIIEAAESGNIDAMHTLGVMYEEGRWVPYDEIEATKWYLKAAQQGHPIAQKDMGYRYLNGEGVEVSYEKSLKWLKEAKKNGYDDSEDSIEINSLIEGISDLIEKLKNEEKKID
ncbi:Sel1 repeat-containing protein [Pseudobutyrivibrio sp. OR37]|nr:Sel1 repeat-containing protein [Pseudobutyrivibrio sp. OR37]